jgi:hypothetical protein
VKSTRRGGIDPLAHTLIRGDPDEAIGRQAYRERITPLLYRIFWIDPDLFLTSFEAEFARRKFCINLRVMQPPDLLNLLNISQINAKYRATLQFLHSKN